MKRAVGAVVVLAGLVVTSGCTGAEDSSGEVPTTEAPSSKPVESQEATAAEDAGDELPTRADMTAAERTLAEAYFLVSVREAPGTEMYEDSAVLAAGDAACDSMDRGDSFQSMLIVTAGMVPDLATTEAVASIAGSAAGTLCPEHAGYSG
jgi:deoxycytidylate deaminase